MGLLNFLGGNSSSTNSSTNSYDQKLGADNGASGANRVQTTGGSVTIGSDQVATAALEANAQALGSVTTLLDKQFTGLYNTANQSLTHSQDTVNAAQHLATTVAQQGSQPATTSFIKLAEVLTVGLVAFAAIRFGGLKL